MNPNFPTSAFQSLTRATAKHNYIPEEAKQKEESPKLPLKKGDLIYIIARDPSNWWNGIILDTNSSRSGWFPASYVKVHDEKTSSNRSSIINLSVKTSTDMLEQSPEPPDDSLKPNLDEIDKANITKDVPHDVEDTKDSEIQQTDGQVNEIDGVIENSAQTRTKDSFNQQLHGLRHSLSQLALTGLTSPRSSPSSSIHASSVNGDGFVPRESPQAKDWKKKTADNGRVYYYNVRTDQTTWTAPDGSGNFMQESSPHMSVASPETPTTATLPRLSDWDNLIQNILMAIAALNQDSKSGFKHKYLQHSTVTSINIRYMLKCCACLDKSSTLLQENKRLRRAHVTLFNSLSAFIRTVRTAVGVWPPPNAVNEMRKTAGNVLLHVREFVKTATSENIPLVLTPPHEELKELSTLLGPTTVVTFEDGQFRVVEMAESDAEVTERLRFFLNNVQNDVEEILNAIEHQESLASQDTQSLVKQIGDVLAYMEELQNKGTLPTDKISVELPEVSVRVLEAKQKLMDSLHCTITSIDGATKEFSAPFAIQQVMLDITILLTALKDAIVAMKTYLEVYNTSTFPNVETGEPMRRSLSNADTLTESTQDTPTRTRAVTNSLPKIDTNFKNLIARNDTLLPSPRVTAVTPRSISQSSQKSSLLVPEDQQSAQDPLSRNPKLRSILGNERLSNHSSHSQARSSASDEARRSHSGDWFLRTQIDSRDIIFTMDGDRRIKAATMEALIENMCDSDHSDSSFVTTMLITFRSFANPVSFFEHLVDRFNAQPPDGLTQKESETWAHSKQTPVQYKVCGILLQWIERNYLRKADFEVLPMLRTFIAKSLHDKFPQEMNDILEVVKARLLDGIDRPSLIETKAVKLGVPPIPITPKGSISRLIDIDPLEIARQLTIMDAKAFRDIEVHEWLTYKPSMRRRSVADIQAADDGGNIRRMITLSNKIAGWVAQTILEELDIKKRCQLIKTFAKVAECCHTLNNFATRESILAGLQASPIHRLKRTFEHVSTKTKTLIEQLTKHMDRENNFKSYRDSLKRVSGSACVPFTGLYMTDLTFVLDGNPTLLYNDRLVNVEKFVKLGGILAEIKQFQSVNYNLVKIEEIQDFLNGGLSVARDADTLFELSLQVEPREREDEKILRLLVEKGFG